MTRVCVKAYSLCCAFLDLCNLSLISVEQLIILMRHELHETETDSPSVRSNCKKQYQNMSYKAVYISTLLLSQDGISNM